MRTQAEPEHVSLRALSFRLGVAQTELLSLAKKAGRSYTEFPLLKGDKVRQIRPSVGRLKVVQQRIHRRVLRHIPLPAHLQGGIRKRSASTNAELHLGQPYVVRLDVKNYFDEIKPAHVFEVWRRIGYSPRLARLLTKLTTARRSLPQGAPSSTTLSNLVLLPADDAILQAIAGSDAIYSRYVDDIVISGSHPQAYIPQICLQVQRLGFRIGRRKTSIQPNHERQEVTGYVVNNKLKISRSRSRRDSVRLAVHQICSRVEGDERSVAGKVIDLGITNSGAAAPLRRRLARRAGAQKASTEQRSHR